MKKLTPTLFFCLAFYPIVFGQLLPPSQFLPYAWGEQFTAHHLVVDYFEHVAANSDKVKLQLYGYTNEKRPLMVAFISTPANLARLDDIRQNNLKRAGILPGTTDAGLDKSIVWLSCSVHGNEAAGSESSMQILFELVDPNNTTAQSWLQNTIIVLDPSVNPDGYSRYTSWYQRMSGTVPDPAPNSREHLEPWPGGRTNHYYFDLNRDWAWQTQIESQQRIKLYNQWLPHLHADLHEQGYNSPYYFAPAAQPYHSYITQWQRDFQVELGRNHAKYFDANGWLYFTKEVFDLLYPSYGDTYPTYNGAIGMTYEQGGGGRGGRAILLDNGDTLTLKDRVMHHKTTALSTVEMGSKNMQRLLDNFKNFWQKSKDATPGVYKSFIIKGDNAKGKIKAFCELLDKNGIMYGAAGNTANLKAYNYETGKEEPLKVESSDLVVGTNQPRGLFVQILMEPETYVVDSLTYDITAWSLPMAYGLKAYACKELVKYTDSFPITVPMTPRMDNPYAFLIPWKSLDDAKLLAKLLDRGIKVRYALQDFTILDKQFDRGCLVITQADNRKALSLYNAIPELAKGFQSEVHATQTGFMDEGKDFGSRSYAFIDSPKVAVLSGEGVSSNSFGQVWHFFDNDLQFPLHIYETNDLGSLSLESFNTLVLTDGRYVVNETALKKLNTWINQGGRLILIGSANRAFEGKEGFHLSQFASDEEKSAAEKAEKKETLDHRLDNYGGEERRSISGDIPGAIFQVEMDETHPLSFGLAKNYFSLKTDPGLQYPHLKESWNVGIIGDKPVTYGFVGAIARQKMKKTAVSAVQDKGRGSIVYLIDNPLYRSFWYNGKMLMSNALFLR